MSVNVQRILDLFTYICPWLSGIVASMGKPLILLTYVIEYTIFNLWREA